MRKHELSQAVTCYEGDAIACLREMPDQSVNCCVTSPPYWGLRDYGTATWDGGAADCDHIKTTLSGSACKLRNDGREHIGLYESEKAATFSVTPYRDQCGKCGATRIDSQLGLEATPELYISKMVEVFREVKRVLRDDGTLWCNMGDSYNNREGQRVQGAEQRDDVAGWKQATNIGSTNVGSRHAPNLKPKDLCGIPWMLAFALRADGWYLRQDIIWAKPNPMPESVTDRCTKSHEYIFLLSKSERYYYNQEATLEPCSLRTPASFKGSIPGRNGGPGQDRRSTADRRLKAWDNDMGSNRTLVSGYGRKLAEPDSGTKNNSSFDAAMAIMPEKRNRRSVWTVNTQSFSDAHFATFPEELIKPCILAGCPPQGTVLDPFGGSGTTGLVAQNNGCKSILIELNPEYIEIMRKRLSQEVFQF